MFVILSLSIATVVMGTTGMSLVSPVFAGGDHHDHDGKKCKDNGDDSCNDTHRTQKIKSEIECENRNKEKDIEQNINAQMNECTAGNANLKDVTQNNSTIFGDISKSPF
jgi:hypothetical protein